MHAALAVPSDRTRPALRTLSTWLTNAWLLFRTAPWRILLLSVFPILVEGVVQLLPSAGIVLSKLLTPFASAWVLVLLDNKARGDRFAMAHAGGLWFARLVPLVPVALVCAGAFAFQLGVAAAFAGRDQAFALAVGDVANLHLGRTGLGLILASGMLPAALLLFLMPRVVLDGVGFARGLRDSLRGVAGHWRPVAMLAMLDAVAIVGMVWFPPLLLALLPFALLTGYTSYRDVFHRAVPV
jgi:hypothetical protein